MMEELGLSDDAPRVIVSVGLEIYLRHREDPIHCLGTFRFSREHLETENKLDNFMTIVTNTFAAAIDDKKVTRIILSDKKFNKFMIQSEDILAVSILAPEETLLNEVLIESD